MRMTSLEEKVFFNWKKESICFIQMKTLLYFSYKKWKGIIHNEKNEIHTPHGGSSFIGSMWQCSRNI